MSTVPETTRRTTVTYVFDPYCGWCFGFGPALTAFARDNADRIRLEVVAGGLFVGDAVVPVVTLPHVAEANARIAALTGAEFGEPYRALAADPEFSMDSRAATLALVVLRAQAPERHLEVAEALQHAFYRDGLSLSDAATVATVADRLGLDPVRATEDLTQPWARRQTEGDFARARALGVMSYPTLLAHLPDGRIARLGGPTSTSDQLAAALAAAVAPARI